MTNHQILIGRAAKDIQSRRTMTKFERKEIEIKEKELELKREQIQLIKTNQGGSEKTEKVSSNT